MRIVIIAAFLGVFSFGYVSADDPVPAVDPNAAPATDNVVRNQGNYAYHAPLGWRIKMSQTGSSTACDMKGDKDCIAMISVSPIYNAASLEKFAQSRIDMDKQMSGVQMSELEPYTTASGWEGFKAVETVTNNGSSMQHVYYFFKDHDDFKIQFDTSCHAEMLDHYTPLFDDAAKSLTRG